MTSVGYRIVTSVLSEDERLSCIQRLGDLEATTDGRRPGVRNLVRICPEIVEIARSPVVASIVQDALGESGRLVRTILFDKTPRSNWKVGWHQDLTIAVTRRRNVPGFGPWSSKAGIVSVQAPADVLRRMVTVRVHLDGSIDDNGPLRVVPGSHRLGRIPEKRIPGVRGRLGERLCEVPPGGALIMRPLLLHASSASRTPRHRRVVHLDFAAGLLPGGLEWHPAA